VGSPSYTHRPLPGPRPWSTISTSVDRNPREDDERTPIARYPASGPVLAERPPAPSHHASPEDTPATSSLSKYECSYCGKTFNRPSSLKVLLYLIFSLSVPDQNIDTPEQPHWREA
jgi:hypothetical protein